MDQIGKDSPADTGIPFGLNRIKTRRGTPDDRSSSPAGVSKPDRSVSGCDRAPWPSARQKAETGSGSYAKKGAYFFVCFGCIWEFTWYVICYVLAVDAYSGIEHDFYRFMSVAVVIRKKKRKKRRDMKYPLYLNCWRFYNFGRSETLRYWCPSCNWMGSPTRDLHVPSIPFGAPRGPKIINFTIERAECFRKGLTVPSLRMVQPVGPCAPSSMFNLCSLQLTPANHVNWHQPEFDTHLSCIGPPTACAFFWHPSNCLLLEFGRFWSS